MNTTWDLVENKIKIENRFRIDVTDYINKMYKTRKNSILPYDINTEDVFEMLQDLTWTDDDKFVVFFNFEFVMCLMKLQVTPDRITYIAPSSESYYEVRDGGWGERGMKSILFDLSIYKKYQTRKQWKSHLMKKIGKLDEFIAVGNIPFTAKNENSEKGSKQIGNQFIELMNTFNKACYILQAKYDSSAFQKNILKNKNLKKITNHTKSIFDIADTIKTCTVLLDKSYISNNFLYSTNVETDVIELNKKDKIGLSKYVSSTTSIDDSKLTLGDLWKNGNRYLNQLSNDGNHKVVKALGRSTDSTFDWTYDSIETTSLGKWKVMLPLKSISGKTIRIGSPEYAVCFSIVSLEVDSEESAYKLKKWIEDNDILQKLNDMRTSGTNSKSLFSKIVLPDGLI